MLFSNPFNKLLYILMRKKFFDSVIFTFQFFFCKYRMNFLMTNIMHHNRLAVPTTFRFGRKVMLRDIFVAEFASANRAVM